MCIFCQQCLDFYFLSLGTSPKMPPELEQRPRFSHDPLSLLNISRYSHSQQLPEFLIPAYKLLKSVFFFFFLMKRKIHWTFIYSSLRLTLNNDPNMVLYIVLLSCQNSNLAKHKSQGSY